MSTFESAINAGVVMARSATAAAALVEPIDPSGWFGVIGRGNGCDERVPVTDLLCDSMRPGTTGRACGACSTGGVFAARLAANLIRVAATRIFADPEQSVLELPTNGLDAHAAKRGQPVTGKFGAGFFSMLYWLFEPGVERAWTRTITIVTNSLRVTLRRGSATSTLHAVRAPGITLAATLVTGTLVRLDCRTAPLSDQQVATMRAYLNRLRFAGISPVVLNNQRLNAGITVDQASPVTMRLDNTVFSVQDSGVGMNWDTVLRQMLVPFRSSKPPPASASESPAANPAITGFYPTSGQGRAVVVVGHVVVIEAPLPVVPECGGVTAGVDVVFGLPGDTQVPVSRDDVMLADSIVPAAGLLFTMAVANANDDPLSLARLQLAVKAIVAHRAGSSAELETLLAERLDALARGDGAVALVPLSRWDAFWSRIAAIARNTGQTLLPVWPTTDLTTAAARVLSAWANRTRRTGGAGGVAHLQRALEHCTVVAMPEIMDLPGEMGGVDGLLFLDPNCMQIPTADDGEWTVLAWALTVTARFPASGVALVAGTEVLDQDETTARMAKPDPLSPESTKWAWNLVPDQPEREAKATRVPTSAVAGAWKDLFRKVRKTMPVAGTACLTPFVQAVALGDSMSAKGIDIGHFVSALAVVYTALALVRKENASDAQKVTKNLTRALAAMRAACVKVLDMFGRGVSVSYGDTGGDALHRVPWARPGTARPPFVAYNGACFGKGADPCADAITGAELLTQDFDDFVINESHDRVNLTYTSPLGHWNRLEFRKTWFCGEVAANVAPIIAKTDALLIPKYGSHGSYVDRLCLSAAVRTYLTESMKQEDSPSNVPAAFRALESQYTSGRVDCRRLALALVANAADNPTNSAFAVSCSVLSETFQTAMQTKPDPVNGQTWVAQVPPSGAGVREVRLSRIFRRVFAASPTGADALAWMAHDAAKAVHEPEPSTALSVAINEGTTREPMAAAIIELFQNAMDATRSALVPDHRGLVHVDIGTRPQAIEITVSNPGSMSAENLLALSIPFLSTKDPSSASASAGEMGSGFFTVYRPPIAGVRIASGGVLIEDTPVYAPDNKRVVDVERRWCTRDTDDGWTRIALVIPRDQEMFVVPPAKALVTQQLMVLCPKMHLNGKLLREDPILGLDPVLVAGDASIARLYVVLSNGGHVLPSHVYTREVPLRPVEWLLAGVAGFPRWATSLLATGAAIELAGGAYTPVQTRSRARLTPHAAGFVRDEVLGAGALHEFIGAMISRGVVPAGAFPHFHSAVDVRQLVPHRVARHSDKVVGDFSSAEDLWLYFVPAGATASVAETLHEVANARRDEWPIIIRGKKFSENVVRAVLRWLEPKLDKVEARQRPRDERGPGKARNEREAPEVKGNAPAEGKAAAEKQRDADVAKLRGRELACIRAYVDVLWPHMVGRAVSDPRLAKPPTVSGEENEGSGVIAAYKPHAHDITINFLSSAWPPGIGAAVSGTHTQFARALRFEQPASWIGFFSDAVVRHELEHARSHAMHANDPNAAVLYAHTAPHPADFVHTMDTRFNEILAKTTFLRDVYDAMRTACETASPWTA